MSRESKSTETEYRLVGVSPFGEGGIGSKSLMHVGFYFGMIKMFWNWIEKVHHTVHVLHAPELFTIKC